MAALLHRERSGGVGQKVSTDLLSAYSAFLMPELLFDHSFPNEDLPPALKVNFHQTLATSDGHLMGLPMTRGQFEGICKVVDRPELIDDPRFDTLASLLTNISALYEEIQPNMLRMTADEFLARTADYDVPFAKVVDVNGFFENEQVRHSGVYVDYDDPELGVIRQLNHPVRYEHSPVDIAKRAPLLASITPKYSIHSQAVRKAPKGPLLSLTRAGRAFESALGGTVLPRLTRGNGAPWRYADGGRDGNRLARHFTHAVSAISGEVSP